MKVLVAPMAAVAETSGPFSRSAALCRGLLEAGHEAVLCAAVDVNYRQINRVRNFECPVPSPLGLPGLVGKTMLKFARLSGVPDKVNVNSFEQVLFFDGVLNKKHFRRDVACIRKAIKEFRPDVLYSEFRPAAIVAAKLEGTRIATGYSFPVQKTFASNPEFCKGIKSLLKEYRLPDIESALDIFQWADLKIVPSSYELEPIDGDSVIFTGPFAVPEKICRAPAENKIIAYMGSGAISPRQLIRELTEAFKDTSCKVYIATEQIKPFTNGNIVVDKRFDFNKLMPGAVAYINHGGQNSIMTGLIFGVPQLICPGNVFERKYNAASVVHLNAGKMLDTEDFRAEQIKKALRDFKTDPSYRKNAISAGEQLASLGGVSKVIEALENLIR